MHDRILSKHPKNQAAETLLVANLNSIVLDFVARTCIGNTDLSFFIIKQLPVLPPSAYQEECPTGQAWTELIVPRVLELTYTSYDLQRFALDLGFEGPPFAWDEDRRHQLRCELDAIYAHLYGLERDELEWILDAPEPSQSFPGLKRSEMRNFGEYRTHRYVLQAYDQLASGELPDLEN